MVFRELVLGSELPQPVQDHIEQSGLNALLRLLDDVFAEIGNRL
jgi:hypothetical protein